MIQKSSLLSDHCLKIPAQTHDTRREFSSCPSDHSLLPHFFSSWRSPRTFGVEGDEGDVVADALAAHLAAVGHGVAGLGAALAVLVVAVVVAGHLHHDGVLPAPGHRAAGKEWAHLGETTPQQECEHGISTPQGYRVQLMALHVFMRE